MLEEASQAEDIHLRMVLMLQILLCGREIFFFLVPRASGRTPTSPALNGWLRHNGMASKRALALLNPNLNSEAD
jgi:hypothetical protein